MPLKQPSLLASAIEVTKILSSEKGINDFIALQRYTNFPKVFTLLQITKCLSKRVPFIDNHQAHLIITILGILIQVVATL